MPLFGTFLECWRVSPCLRSFEVAAAVPSILLCSEQCGNATQVDDRADLSFQHLCAVNAITMLQVVIASILQKL